MIISAEGLYTFGGKKTLSSQLSASILRIMRYKTLQFRIKDATTGKHLSKMAGAVNFVWNYCNQVNQERWLKFRKTFTNYDLHQLTSGCAKELGINSTTVQATADVFTDRRQAVGRTHLAWRSRKRSLGWIPFKQSAIKITGDSIRYQKKSFRFWLSRPIEGIVRYGSFSQDAQGHWYVNLTLEEADRSRAETGEQVGLDLGLKTIATLSDGLTLSRQNLTSQYSVQLAKAQRAHKKKRVKVIHAKIKRKRNDWTHKATTQLVRDYDRIIVGNVSSAKLIKTRLAKSVSDASWYSFKTMLYYKAAALSVEVKEVNERYSTVTCSACGSRSGPRGLRQLGVRVWRCGACGCDHDRDVNAATNILHSVRGIER